MVGQRNEISRRLLKDNIIPRENRKGEDQMNQARGGPLSSVSSFSFGPYILHLWMDYVYSQIYLFIYLHGMACIVHYATLDDTEWLWPLARKNCIYWEGEAVELRSSPLPVFVGTPELTIS